MPRPQGAVPRAVTAAVEYGVSRAGLAAARVLDRDVIGQAHHPRGAAGRVTAWEMAHRPSNRQRSRWVVSLLDIQPADQVLELGFGPGVAIAELARAAPLTSTASTIPASCSGRVQAQRRRYS